jgi:hypothetical protein
MESKTALVWAQRAAEWKASGLTSKAFCEGKDINPDTLRHWASLIQRRKTQVVRAERPAVRVARVIRGSSDSRTRMPASQPEPVIVEIGGARISVRPGFDRMTLTALLEILSRSGRGAR